MKRDTAKLLLLAASWMTLSWVSAFGQTSAAGLPQGRPATLPTADTATAPPMLSPQAAYDQASAPVDIIHRDIANWSDIEINALENAQAQAKSACDARVTQTYAGDDLISYARLCSMGQEWQLTLTAATTYINTKDDLKLQLAMAYTFEVQAELNMNNEKAALGSCEAMLKAVPYGPISDEVTSTTIRYLQFAYTADALTLLSKRQPYLLDLLRAAALPADAQAGAAAGPNNPGSIPLHKVFEHALDFAAIEQYDNQAGLAAIIMKDIDQATPKEMPPDEAIFIAADRKQYALLGTKFPELPGAAYLMSATETPLRQPNFGAANIFLLFPPWCAQCIRQAQEIVPAMVGAAILHGPDTKIYIYALLADNPPVPAKVVTKAAPGAAAGHAHHAAGQEPANHAAETPEKADQPPSVQDQLRKTPTLVVAPSSLADFNALDFPFLIATDREGIIRLMVPAAPKNALVQGGPAEQITDTIVVRWPAPRVIPEGPGMRPPPPPPPGTTPAPSATPR